MRRRVVRVVEIPHTSSTIIDNIYSNNPNYNYSKDPDKIHAIKRTIYSMKFPYTVVETKEYDDGQIVQEPILIDKYGELVRLWNKLEQRIFMAPTPNVGTVERAIALRQFLKGYGLHYKRRDKLNSQPMAALKVA